MDTELHEDFADALYFLDCLEKAQESDMETEFVWTFLWKMRWGNTPEDAATAALCEWDLI